MSWTPIDGRVLSIDDAVSTVPALMKSSAMTWAPSGGVLHNTSSPSLARSQAYSIEHWRDMWVGFFRDTQGWSGGPHYFCFPDKVLLFTPITYRGTHSPSWNGTKFGLEMVAEFDTEDDKAGLGLQLKHNAARMFAAIYGTMGWDPEGIRMHYEDPKTTHACPGKHLNKAEFIGEVLELLGHAGEHLPMPVTATPAAPPAAPPIKIGTINVAAGQTLNLRQQSNALSAVIEKMAGGTKIKVLGSAQNGSTNWSRVQSPAGHTGWAASRFINLG